MPQKFNYELIFHNSCKDEKFLRYLDTELNLCICFDKLNKNNEPLVPLAFDLYQLPSHNQAQNSIQDMSFIHNLIKFSTGTLKQWRGLDRTKLNFTKKRKINFKRPYLSRKNSTIRGCQI
ncbi:hypothetical protein VP01_2723g3 [Puccinia sorghi]|uniref:Uncharacterized protein n=1 Tax=Puccinia sorghi TaxID=27349 RepID=A0A0L6V3B3_9BASI|nr:hypothetical protein VP01_2723g3 [Puccinia sorghi]